MFRIPKAVSIFCVAATLVLGTQAHSAPTNISFAGVFTNDDDVQLFSFTADGASSVRLISYSYGGGTQANGNVVSAGGFDPILALFDSSGNLIGQNDDSEIPDPGSCGPGVVNPDNGTQEWDTCFDQILAAGTYQVAIMQFDNFAVGPTLGDGFSQTGNPSFTNGPSIEFVGCSNGKFCNGDGQNRTSAWAFDILNVESAEIINVPEPGMLALFAIGLVGLGFARPREAA